MTIPFSKTTRQLEANRSQFRLAVLAILILLCTVWVYWFITAEISLSSRSTAANLRTSNQIVATFPADDYFLLSEGQAADFIIPQSGDSSLVYLPATITSMEPDSQGVVVRLSLEPGPPLNARPGITGSVQVETGKATPFELLLRYMSFNQAGIQR